MLWRSLTARPATVFSGSRSLCRLQCIRRTDFVFDQCQRLPENTVVEFSWYSVSFVLGVKKPSYEALSPSGGSRLVRCRFLELKSWLCVVVSIL